MSEEKIGDLCEVRGELTVEWKVKKTALLSEDHYSSPNFYFASASWSLLFCPVDGKEVGDDEYITIFLMRSSSGPPVAVSRTFRLVTPCAKLLSGEGAQTLFEDCLTVSTPAYIFRSTVETYEQDEITISCSVECINRNDISESYFHGLQLVSHNLRDIYKSRKRTDFILKVGEENLHAHRMILEAHSPVFAAMFNDDTEENETGEVSIVDLDKSAVDGILEYIYSGELEKLTNENVLSLYAAAKKYEIKDTKSICFKFILRNLSGDWLCDIIKFGYLSEEEEIVHYAKEYFTNNSRDVLASDKWKAFVRKSPDTVLKFLS